MGDTRILFSAGSKYAIWPPTVVAYRIMLNCMLNYGFATQREKGTEKGNGKRENGKGKREREKGKGKGNVKTIVITGF